jgi:hypothetical protein
MVSRVVDVETPSVLDGGSISVFSHNTDTTYEKNKTEGAKNKGCKPQGGVRYLTLFFIYDEEPL